MSILITGGAGFIGSHTSVELILAQYEVIIVDNFENSNFSVIQGIEKITGIKPTFYEGNVINKGFLREIFEKHNIDVVIHFAGYKSVAESVQFPIRYYRNNIDSLLTLLEVMKEFECKKIIFSSSATVYGLSNNLPFTENEEQLGCTNPYGWTKFMNEQILKDISNSEPDMSIVILRYFNPIGAHESGIIGERPNGVPDNLMPYITQVASGVRERLNIYGDNYQTDDGTCIRDYIHVVDLAKGHVKACDFILKNRGCEVFNLGTGIGYSVLDVVKTFEKVNDIKVPYAITNPRQGDVAVCYSKTTKAEEKLGWKAEKSLNDMCRDSWNWQKKIYR